jgi:DNA-binding Lrp family transcriptional regulator
MLTQSIDDALRVIQQKPEGVLQSDLWKILDVDSRKCSRIVKKLIDSGLIERIEFRKNGIKTFVLKARRRPVDPGKLLAGEELIPCIACDQECTVELCPRLLDWMYQLAICEVGE